MNSPLLAFERSEPEPAMLTRKKADVLPINAAVSQLFENLSAPSAALALGHFNQGFDYRDSKALDYLIIGILSLFVHAAAVDFFKKLPVEQEELIEPVKIPSKMQISFVQPKPVVQPPPPVVKQPPPPPPPPKVVAIKKPPKPKVLPKPAPKVIQQQPLPDIPVSKTAVAAPIISAPPAPVAVPKPIEKVTQPSSGAGYLNNPKPGYPDVAMDRGWEGKVLMKVHVLASGHPDSVSVMKSSGHEVLDDEAVKTVKKWSFVPAKRGTTPIDGWVTVPIAFNLG